MNKTFKVKDGDEIITFNKGYESEDAGYFDIETIRIKMKKATKEALKDALNAIGGHPEWWGIEVRCDDEVNYLTEENQDDPDFRADVEYFRVSSDCIVFYAQHKHNAGAQIEGEPFEII